jgi:hypothetical protein
MTKKIIALSAIAAIATTSFASTDVETRLSNMEKKIKKLEKKLKQSKRKLNAVKAHDAGDNIKWDVDFRSTIDKITYTHASGKESSNDGLMTNRLLLNMKFKPEDTVSFYSTLAYNKVYGATTGQSNQFENFDWVTNETASTDSNLKVKEAYWLYANDTFFGAKTPWTASIGRRPSTGGLGINYREGDNRKSAIASTVNVEFDGASFKWNLDQVTPLEGSWFKLCMGRGITNATQRFNDNAGADYATNSAFTSDSDMIGFIYVPYDNGQYSVHTNWATANNLIGYDFNAAGEVKTSDGTYSSDMTKAAFQNVGGIDLTTIVLKADGIGEEISDYLDNTTVFMSWAQSKTDPTNTAGGMLGSTDSQTGNMVWIGAQMPCLLVEGARVGIEWNKGSQYWRSMTYAEDTAIGSKIAARGTALEVYWLKPLTKSLSMNIRYTKIDYDYTGSNAFFGADGNPMTMADAILAGQDPIEKASDLRVAIRYKF